MQETIYILFQIISINRSEPSFISPRYRDPPSLNFYRVFITAHQRDPFFRIGGASGEREEAKFLVRKDNGLKKKKLQN